MSSPWSRTRTARPVRRLRTRATASAAAIAISAIAVVGTAVPAQARPRSCASISQSITFFWLAMQGDVGESAPSFAADSRAFNYEIAVFVGSGC